MEPPAWSRLVYGLSRALSTLESSQQILRDELLLAFVPPEQRSALTLHVYSRSSSYGQGGEAFLGGLFPWEEALLDHPRIPRSGRVLLAAAGGGRELLALEQRGYEVYAFEPVQPLFDFARSVACPETVVVKASYQDLMDRAEGRDGPLSNLGPPFAFCLLGWTSLTHLTAPGEALAVLRALRAIAPHAPVMTSFFTRPSGPMPTAGGARKLRRLLRRTLEAMGGRSVPQGLQFFTQGGFCHAFSKEELVDLCKGSRYELEHFSELGYPHALLIPAERNHADVSST